MFTTAGIRTVSVIAAISSIAIAPSGCVDDEDLDDSAMLEDEALDEDTTGKSDGAAYLQLGGIKYYPVTTLGCADCGPAHDQDYTKALGSASYGHYYYADVHRSYRFLVNVCSQDFHPIAYLQYPDGKIEQMQPYEAVDATHCTSIDLYGPRIGRYRILLRSGNGRTGDYSVHYFNEVNRL